MRTTLALLVMLAACGGDEVPTCQEAISHYYSAGCRFFDSTGNQTPELEAISNCQGLLREAPRVCLDEVDDFRACLGGVPNPSTNADCVTCADEQEALLTCDR